jgi:hypothetical protein
MTFDKWWEEETKTWIYTVIPIDWAKRLAKEAWDRSAKNGEAYHAWVVRTDNGRHKE